MFAFVFAVLALASAVRGLPAQDTAHVVVVATTDVHGHVNAWDYVADRPAPWGLSRAATVVDSVRAAYPGAVVLVDAGDLIQGNPYATYFATVQPRDVNPVVDGLNALHYDVATPGNHEFNFGLDVLARAYAGAAFPIVSANIFRLPRDTLAFPPYVILPRSGGVRVGVTGFTTPGTMLWDREHLRGRLLVRRILPLVSGAVQELRDAGADLTVVLLHSGMSGSSYDTTGIGPENVGGRIAFLPTRPDLVIVGHSHQRIRDSVINGVHFVQPQAWARSVSVVHVWLVREGARSRVVRIVGDEVPLADVAPDPVIERRFAALHDEVRAWVGTPIATAEGDWSAREARARDTPLIDFVNRVQRHASGAQLSATAAFNTSARLGPGAVRLRDVAGLYPYENTLKAVRIDGERLRRYLEQSARYYRSYVPGTPLIDESVPGYNFDIVSGVRYEIDLTSPVGARIRNLTYQGRAVTATDTFTLALNSYRQVGGGGFDMLAGLPVVYDRGENIRDLLVEAARAAGTLRAQDYFEDSWRLVPAEDTVLLRVLATNDVHGSIAPATPEWAGGRRVGGSAATKALMDSLAKACGCPTVRLDAGDAFQGTPISNFFFGRPVVEVYNAMGYDAAAIGNHDFDWSIDTLRARIAESTFPWLAANITDTATGQRPPWAGNWTMVERGGRHVAVIGATTPATATTTNPLNVASLAFGDPTTAVRSLVPAARAAGADVVVILAHAGAQCDTACHGESVRIAQGMEFGGVDLVVGGHTSGEVLTTVNGIPVVQVRHNGGEIAVVDLVRRAGGWHQVRMRIDTVWTDSLRPDPQVARIVDDYAAKVEQITARPVAALKFALPRGPGPEYALGRLIADAFRNAARADVGLMNNGGIRADLPGGTVTYGQLFRVMPFGNRVVRLTISGDVLLQVLEYVLSDGRPHAHVSGIAVRYDPARPQGRRIREARLLDGRRIEPKTTYTLAAPDFVAVGGSGYEMLVGQPLAQVGVTDLEAVIRYLQRLPQPVEISSADRFVPTR
jgi:2',3'-cyclic-nucleotide 2'-phosphodiesterase/3'-nucleotidase/5'-nucleotidase